MKDRLRGVYQSEGGYIVGYDGNGTYDSEDLEPDWNSWDEVWSISTADSNLFSDEAKMTGAWAGYYDAQLTTMLSLITCLAFTLLWIHW